MRALATNESGTRKDAGGIPGSEDFAGILKSGLMVPMLRGIYDVLTNPATRPEWRWRVFYRLRNWIMPGYRLQWPQMCWWQDAEFNDYLHRFGESHGLNADRRWTVSQLVKLVGEVPGDTAECGVLFGSSSYLICRALPERMHHMFDSFEGMSEPSSEDGNYFKSGGLACNLDVVMRNLKEFPNTTYHKGWIPDKFGDVVDERFAFVHIDVQLYQPTLNSLQFFYPRTNPRGIMVFDDYGFTTCPGARRAIDEFFYEKPENIIELSTGSAFIIKHG